MAPLVELCERSLHSGERRFERLADADLGESADGLGRAVADALSKALSGSELRAARELRHAGLRGGLTPHEPRSHLLEINRGVRRVHSP